MGFQNYYASKITNAIGAGDTTVVVDTAPSVTSGRMALEARNSTQREVIKYTNVSGNTLTGVTRGQGGTTAKAHVAGSLIEMNATAEDLQDLYDAFNSFAASNTNWVASPYTFSSVTALGNRSYQCVVNGQNLTNIWSAGMRLRSTRTVAAPTQSTLLNGTTQYYSRLSASVNGMTFTDDFSVSVHVPALNAYPVAAATIASRYNGASGWSLQIGPTGQVYLYGFNAGSYSEVHSYQSVPLGKKFHVALQLDMSAFTATTTTSYVMIDGVDVPATVTRTGTNPTALVQAGNLEIGASNSGTGLLNGKLAQVAIYNAKVTQATILASMNQGLAGTETSLISAYSFNGVITDLNTTNANNLTANGSAVATNADSPFGGQADGTISSTLDYAIIQKVAFSTNTTVTVQVPEGCTIPTSGGVSSVVYSSNKAPYGMPVQRGKWSLRTQQNADLAVGGTANTWYGGNAFLINLPIGSWRATYWINHYSDINVAGYRDHSATLSTTTSTETDQSMTDNVALGSLNSTTATRTTHSRTGNIDLTAATIYYGLVMNRNNASNTHTLNGVSSIEAENAYL